MPAGPKKSRGARQAAGYRYRWSLAVEQDSTRKDADLGNRHPRTFSLAALDVTRRVGGDTMFMPVSAKVTGTVLMNCSKPFVCCRRDRVL